MRTSVLMGSMLVLAACSVCVAVAPTGAELCTTSSGGLGVTIFGGNESYSGLACQATHDGGTLDLSVTGNQCAINTTAPIHSTGSAACNVATVPAGTYTVTLPAGTPTTLTLPLAADAGLPSCQL